MTSVAMHVDTVYSWAEKTFLGALVTGVDSWTRGLTLCK